MFKGKPGEPLVEETTFGWVVHGGDEYGSGSTFLCLREVNDYEKLYTLDILEIKDRGDDELEVLRDLKKSVVRKDDGRYEPITYFRRFEQTSLLWLWLLQLQSRREAWSGDFRHQSHEFKEKYFNSQTWFQEWSYGSEYGEEPWHCSSPMAHQIYHHLDGQNSGVVLDNQSWEGMESVCGQ